MKNKSILSIILAAVILLAALPINGFIITKAENSELGILNGGGFESQALWKNANGRTEANDAFEGEYIVKGSEQIAFSENFAASAYAKYTVGFWYKNSSDEENRRFFVADSEKNEISAAELSVSSVWTYGSFEFYTGDKSGDYYFGIEGEGLEIDAVSVYNKTVGNLVLNGSFEAGLEGWKQFGEGATVSSQNPDSGFVSANLSVSENSGIYYEINLSQNTEYTVTLSYVGGGKGSGWGIAAQRGEVYESLIYGINSFEASEEWKTVSGSFNSGLNEKARLVIFGASVGSVSVDSVSVSVSESQNLLTNGGFENKSWHYGWKYSNGSYPIISNDFVNSGNQALRLSNNNNVAYYQTVDVEPDTDYIVSFACWSGNGNDWSVIRVLAGDSDSYSGDRLWQTNLRGEAGVWREYSQIVNTGAHTKLSVGFVTDASGVKPSRIDDVCLRKKPISTNDTLLVKNGGFENGLSNWSNDWGSPSADSEIVHSGNYSLKLAKTKYASVYQTVKLERNTDYMLSLFRYGGDRNDWSSLTVQGGDDWSERLAYTSLKGTEGQWGAVTLTFNSGENSSIRIKITTDSADSTIRLDDIYILPMEADNKVVNGGFEGTLARWGFDSDSFALSQDAQSGTSALGIYSGYYKNVSQDVELEAGKNYRLSFWYKGKVPDDISAWAVSNDLSFKDKSVIVKGKLSNSDEFTKVTRVFTAPQNARVYIMFQTTPGAEYVIDGVTLSETAQAAEPCNTPPAAAQVNRFMRGPITEAHFMSPRRKTICLKTANLKKAIRVSEERMSF